MNYVCGLLLVSVFLLTSFANFSPNKWVDLIDLSSRKDQREALVGHPKKGSLVRRRVPLRVWPPVQPQFTQASIIEFRLR